MDSKSRKKIRKLKTSVLHQQRSSLDEPLLSRAEEGEADTLTAARSSGPGPSRRVSFADEPAGRRGLIVPSPFDNNSSNVNEGGSRDGRQLWALAFARVRNLRRQSSQRASNDRRSIMRAEDAKSSVLEHFLFSLHSIHSTRTTGLLDGGSRSSLLEPHLDEPHEPPGAFAIKSDLAHLGHMMIASYLNFLLLAIPLGIVSGALHLSPTLTFSANFLALLPLALILGEITEDLALRFGDAIGGLLNASFGNVVEMILGLAALKRGLYDVVAASLIGSILSNLLLVLGCCFLFGGFKHKHQRFNTLANKVSSSLLFLACIAIITPTMAHSMYGDDVITQKTLRSLSHAIALLLIGMYGCYLYFQLKTHADSFSAPDSYVLLHPADSRDFGALTHTPSAVDLVNGSNGGDVQHLSRGASHSSDLDLNFDEHQPALSLSGAIGTLFVITVLVAICSEYLTGAIEAVSTKFNINQSFLGLIVLPIAGNAAEHITAVFVAIKNKMDLAISVALGSSIQIAIFVLPVTVLAGWAMGNELTLDLDPFAVVMLTVSVILTYFVTSDGSSNWLLGLQLIMVYVLIGSVFLLEKEAKKEAPESEEGFFGRVVAAVTGGRL